MPKLSIIVTAYNIETYIRQCLDCVLAQTLKDIEIIVVDDGSTDGTPDIIRQYAQKDMRIKPILFEKNTIGGVATAANAGMDVATGDFIGFADGDDIYDSQMFGRLYEAAVAHSADLAMCAYQLLDVSTGQLKDPAEADRWRAYPQEVALDLDDTTRREMLRFISVPWRKIYRRDLVERIKLRFPVGDFFYEDNPFHWASILGGQRIVLIPDKLCQHRVARSGQTMVAVDSRLLRIFNHHDNIRDWLRLHGLDRIYGNDLLDWTANQLSWVSQRTEGPLQRKLFDVLRPVIDQYDTNTVEEFGRRNGRGRAFLMLTALKAKNFSGFARAAQSGGPENDGLAVGSGALRGGTLMSRGLFHLRHSGIRETVRMTGRYMREKAGIGPVDTPSRAVQNRHRLTNDDIMAALVILQRDIRGLRSDLGALRDEDISSAKYRENSDQTGALDHGSDR